METTSVSSGSYHSADYLFDLWEKGDDEAFEADFRVWVSAMASSNHDPEFIAETFKAFLERFLKRTFGDALDVSFRLVPSLSGFRRMKTPRLMGQRFADDLCRFLAKHRGCDRRPLVLDVRDTLDACSDEELQTMTVDVLAERLGYSRGHFTRLASKEYRQSVNRILINAKLDRVFLLLQQWCSVIEAAQALGFSNQDRFRRFFKQRYGFLPSELRRV